MNHSTLKKALSILLAVMLIVSTLTVAASAVDVVFGDFAIENADNMYLIQKKKTQIAPGIVETQIVTNGTDGDSQVMGYAVSVDLSGGLATLAGGYADYSGAEWKMQTVRQQANAYEKATGNNVVVAVNADGFNMGTGEPDGPLVLGGTNLRAGLGHPYFAIMKDGTAKIGGSFTQEDLDNCVEAVGGFHLLAKDGVRTSTGLSDGGLAPRTAVGIKADGSVVVYVGDGRNYPISCGLNMYDLTSIMLGFGCVDILNFDGGGSTTFASQREGTNSLEVINNPSDGSERKVSSSLFIVSNAKPSGEFDHAALTPNADIYTPGASVQFSAIGVDSSGTKVDLPADGKFELADSSFGTIDAASGLFTSNGKTGEVAVNYVSGSAVVGSTSIQIQHPTEIYFGSEEVSLGFDKQSDLGLVVTYNEIPMLYRDGDFTWTMTDTTMGTFNGNIFTSSDSATVSGKITCTYTSGEYTVSGTIDAIIGRLPQVQQDFESDDIVFGRVAFNANGGIAQWENQTEGYNMLTGHYLNGDGTSRGGLESAEIVDIASGEPVRFGKQSLKLNYDFSNANGIEGACIGFTQAGQEIEGNPTGIGMWVYAPEGCRNFWLRIRILDGSNNILTLNYSPQYSGMDWEGWKYVECDLTGYKGPFKLMAGETIRLMYTNGAYGSMGDFLAGDVPVGETAPEQKPDTYTMQPKSECKGSIYIDNLQFVYGANVDDIDNPNIDSISIGTEEIESGKTVVNTNSVNMEARFSDVQNRYTTGIDHTTILLYVDGVNRTEEAIRTDGDDRINLYDLKLANGEHTVTVSVRDKFGNETKESRIFVVNGEEDVPSVQLEIAENIILGQDFDVTLTSEDIDNITELDTTIAFGKNFTNPKVEFASEFTGTYSVDEKTNKVTIHAERTQTLARKVRAAENYIAKLTFTVPETIKSDIKFTYTIENGTFSLADSTDTTLANSFSSGEQAIGIVAPLAISTPVLYVGKEAVITVTDINGAVVEGAEIYSSGVSLGTTDANGVLTNSDITSSMRDIVLTAQKGEDISYEYITQALQSIGDSAEPLYIILNQTEDYETVKNISWMSSPIAAADKAVVRYALKSDYEANGAEAFTEVTGTTVIKALNGSTLEQNYAVRVCNVKIAGLAKDSEYVYSVGDGTVFSDVAEMKTGYNGQSTNFFIIGDTQAEDAEGVAYVNDIIASIENSDIDFSFGVQTGDFVEKPTLYTDWKNILTAYDSDVTRNIDAIHVIGNHEQFVGADNDVFARNIFNADEKGYYSVEYGNVYVAVIDYVIADTRIQEAAAWLVEDAAQSNCQWKIVLAHQPPYGTNAAASDVAEFRKYIPDACEAAGIDVMFSGHDHAFARTEPMTDGQVDEENGVVYYICGSTGEKSYTATNNPDYHFAVVDQEYSAIYLTVEATNEEFKIVTHEKNGSAMDTYIIEADEECVDGSHEYIYDNGYFTCSLCGWTNKATDYTGFATDKATGRNMYFLGGVVRTGWMPMGEEFYYFDENGLALTGEHKLGDINATFKFDDEGKQIGAAFEKFDGGTRAYRGSDTQYLVSWHLLEGNYYYFSRSNGAMRTGAATVTLRTNQQLDYVFANDGRLLEGAFYEYDGYTYYYWGPEMVSGWQVINGNTYYFSPENQRMADDTTEIDGKVYAFRQDGVLAHEGAHEWEFVAVVTKGKCIIDEESKFICTVCNNTKIEVTKEAPGHIDANGNTFCDTCKISMSMTGIFDTIYLAFRELMNMFRNIFDILGGASN